MVWSGIHLFFRRVVVKDVHRLPKNRPVVLVANHQNALLDPVVLCVSTSLQLHWLTRADVFKSRPADWFLRKINMMPVYRERDRVADLHDRNNEVFRQCYDRMKSNAVIGIFPEGTHRGKKQLVPLKKGLARLVIGAHEAGVNNVCIVPVGLDYESFYEPQKNLLVKFGEPIEVAAFLNNPNTTASRLHAEITQAVQQALVKLMVHIDNDHVHHEILALKPLLDARHAEDALIDKYNRFHAVAGELDSNAECHVFLNHQVNQYRTGLHQLRIDEELFSQGTNVLQVLFALIGVPVALLAALVFLPIYLFTERFVHTVIKDTLFRNSIRISFWTFLTPLYLLLIFTCMKWAGVTGYALHLPWISFLAGLIALPWWRTTKKVVHSLRCFRMRNDQSFREWLEQREEVMQWLNTIPYLKDDVQKN